jgi:hypothetical protein
LKEWILGTDWIHESIMTEWNKGKGTASSSTDVPEAQETSNDLEEEA